MKRRNGLLSIGVCALALLTLLAAGLALFGQKPKTAEPVSESARYAVSARSSMDEFVIERETTRRNEIDELHAIISAEPLESEMRAVAEERLLSILEWADQETTLEGLLAVRGYDQALVTVHRDSVNVIVRTDALAIDEASVILEMVARETGQMAGNIKIIPIQEK